MVKSHDSGDTYFWEESNLTLAIYFPFRILVFRRVRNIAKSAY
jgi:hypothetical protein